MSTGGRNKSAFVLAGDIIGQLMETFRTQKDGQLSQIWSLWGEAVGNQIAAKAQPKAYKGRILHVNVQSSVWMMELRYLKSDIIRRINESLGNEVVKEIKFKVGPT